MLTRGFIKLLKRYREGTLKGRVREAMDVWFHTIQKDPKETHSKEEIKDRIWSGIIYGKEVVEGKGKLAHRQAWWRKSYWRVAAGIGLIGTLSLSFYLLFNSTNANYVAPEIATNASQWKEKTNISATPLEVFLPDGSKVVLEPGARLRYLHPFESTRRTVHLLGSGFFDVVKDSDRPFLVYSGAVVTRVLGTSFSIRSIAETGGTEVAVMTGKVMVERNKPRERNQGSTDRENRVILTPNKKVTFFENSELYVTGLVANPVLVANREEFLKPGAFDFDETPLSEVLAKLEKAYGVEITLSNDEMLDCPVTADLTSDNLYGKIEIIGAVLNAEYEITGSAILLSGGGCGPAKKVERKNLNLMPM